MKLHNLRPPFPEIILALVLLTHSFAVALEVPQLRGRVNDLADILPSDRARLLEERLAAFEKETGHQIAVLTIPSLEGDPLEDFSIRVAESWKIGQKGFDNGAILLVAQKERKLRIEVGYGLEGVLPDAIANRIIREVIVPRLRENDYAGGIEAGVNAILQVTKGESL
ncbi:MAG TPA: TPM domain-containing protein, partial [Acidobacteriota bacterium]